MEILDGILTYIYVYIALQSKVLSKARIIFMYAQGRALVIILFPRVHAYNYIINKIVRT